MGGHQEKEERGWGGRGRSIGLLSLSDSVPLHYIVRYYLILSNIHV